MRQCDFGMFLKTLLEPENFRDFSPNGICVEASDEARKVVTGVSFRESLIDSAIEEQADTIIVHHAHGFWSNEPKLPIGVFGKKIAKLFEHKISLYGFHLPLDAHPEIGNNALIAKAFNAPVVKTFMREGRKDVACIAELPKALSKENFLRELKKIFPFGPAHSFLYGTPSIQKLAICTGSAASAIEEAFDLGADCFLTGEVKETTPILAEESNFNVVACGHHRTETFGVKALAELLERELKIPAKFIDLDNPI